MKWEYKVLAVLYGTIPEDLATIGQDGWELICIEVHQNVGGWNRWVFKRPLRETQWERQ